MEGKVGWFGGDLRIKCDGLETKLSGAKTGAERVKLLSNATDKIFERSFLSRWKYCDWKNSVQNSFSPICVGTNSKYLACKIFKTAEFSQCSVFCYGDYRHDNRKVKPTIWTSEAIIRDFFHQGCVELVEHYQIMNWSVSKIIFDFYRNLFQMSRVLEWEKYSHSQFLLFTQKIK